MLQSEFENLTGIYPDMVLFEEINKEYMDGDWEDKHCFCAAYKGNVDGLAEKLQRKANERIWKQDVVYGKTIASNNEIISSLHRQLAEAETRIAELEKQLAIKASALTLETITNKDAVRLMIAGVESDLRNYCTSISEGAFYDTYLERVKMRITQYEELQALLKNME